ncbi:MAG: universal stress protein [Chloroflexi bacterium]|nr:universal stress protein [Chloroflexota bacterium]
MREVEIGGYDLVVMGVRGMGETWRRGRRQHQVIGSVCERVVRRVRRDVLVAKGDRPLGGVFVVGIDGSDRSFAALRIALALARAAGARVQAVENVLTAEARKVFNTAQQRKLHEELIDSGIAKIYDDHLATAQRIAAEDGMELETTLLAGKPYATLLRHVEKVQPSLLAVGRTGVHADEGLDIGSNAENLLRLAPCHVLLVARSFAPTWAETSTIVVEHLPWTPEALARLERVPAFVRGMARRAVEDYARERGLAAVDEQTVQQARERFGA